MSNRIGRAAFALLGVLAAGCRHAGSTAQIPAVSPFDFPQYLGTWHEAARLPQWFEKGLTEVTAEYDQAADGTIRVCNRGKDGDGERSICGRVRQKRENTGELEVSFFRPFYGAYRVVALQRDYSAALVVGANRDSAWILVRDPDLAKEILPEYLALLRGWGFDVACMEYPPMRKGP